jgi:hypothetical protein
MAVIMQIFAETCAWSDFFIAPLLNEAAPEIATRETYWQKPEIAPFQELFHRAISGAISGAVSGAETANISILAGAGPGARFEIYCQCLQRWATRIIINT